MSSPAIRSLDEARRRYADELHEELCDTSDWLAAPNRAASTNWKNELTGRLRRWIGAGEGFGFPAVVRLAKNLAQRMQTPMTSAATGAPGAAPALSECLGVIGQMQQQLRYATAPRPQPTPPEEAAVSVLLVDGREPSAPPLAGELSRIGLAVHWCRSVAEARAWLKHQTPQAIVLNSHLPDGDSLMFCRHLAAQPRLRSTLLTILAERDGISKADALRAGAHACYDQPTDPLLIAMRLDDLLRQRAQRAAQPRVLIADPDATRAGRLIRALQRYDFDPTADHDPDRLLETIATFRPDIVLLRDGFGPLRKPHHAPLRDGFGPLRKPHHAPLRDGFALCRLLRHEEHLTAMPIILLTPSADDRTTLKGLEAGADDVLATSTSTATLAAAMRMRLSRLRQLTIMADRDGLTGLWNHDYFARHLTGEVERATRYGGQFVLAIADLDDFKHLNDTYGHLTGDRALQQVAAFLKRRFRRTDLIARYGGEEFVVLLYQTTLAQAHHVLTAVCQTPPSLRLPGEEEATIPLDMSMGAAEFPTHGWESDSIFHAADQALYEAKRLGKHRIACAPAAA